MSRQTRLSLRLDPADLQALRALRDSGGLSLSELVREGIALLLADPPMARDDRLRAGEKPTSAT